MSQEQQVAAPASLKHLPLSCPRISVDREEVSVEHEKGSLAAIHRCSAESRGE